MSSLPYKIPEKGLLKELFEATYDPNLTNVDRNELEGLVLKRIDELTCGVDRMLPGDELVKELDRRICGYMVPTKDSQLFATDFTLNKGGNCVVYADLIVVSLEYLGRGDVLGNIGVKQTYNHVWLTYDNGYSSFEINANGLTSEKKYPIQALIATNWNNRGVVLHDSGKFHEAIECGEKAIDLDSECLNALILKGAALYNLGRRDEAVEWFKKVAERFNLGEIEFTGVTGGIVYFERL